MRACVRVCVCACLHVRDDYTGAVLADGEALMKREAAVAYDSRRKMVYTVEVLVVLDYTTYKKCETTKTRSTYLTIII